MANSPRITADSNSPLFDTLDQAATGLTKQFGSTAKDVGEKAGVLFQNSDGKFLYSTAITGTDDNFSLNAEIPKGYKLAGIVHSHPSSDASAQIFSPHDVQVAKGLNVPSYVQFLKDGSTRKYVPGKTATQNVLLPGYGQFPSKVARGDPLDAQPSVSDAPTQDASTNSPASTVNVQGSELDDYSTNTGLNLGSLVGTGASLLGTGLSAYNQQQSYDTLQNALNTIGPTSLNGYSLSGPGGMSSGYNPNGSASIDLGSLNPAFGNLSNAAAGSSSAYSPALLSGLTNNAAGTLGSATSALNGAYGNYNAGLNAANTQLGNLNQTYGQVYNNTLSSLQATQQPQVQQQAFGLQNTLFGNGTLNSSGATSGALAAANFGSQVNAMNAQDSLTAQQQALNAQTAGAQNYSTLTNAANGVLSNAFNNFGNTNQLISGLNSASLNNSINAVQGAGALNTIGLNNYNSALQTGATQATARNQSLFPYASVATALSGTQNGSNILANALSGMGSSLTGGSGISSLFSSNSPVSSLLKNYLNSGSSANSAASYWSGMNSAYGSPAMSDLGSYDLENGLGGDLSDLDGAFDSAGGEAAGAGADAGATAGGAEAAGDAAGAAGAADAGADAAAGAGAAEGGSAAGSSLAGSAAGVAIAAAPVIAGLMTPGVQLDASYFSNLSNALKNNAPQIVNGQPVYPGATPQQQQQAEAAYNGAAQELMGDMGNISTSNESGNTLAPSQLQQYAGTLWNPVTGSIGIGGWGSLASQWAPAAGGAGGGLKSKVVNV